MTHLLPVKRVHDKRAVARLPMRYVNGGRHANAPHAIPHQMRIPVQLLHVGVAVGRRHVQLNIGLVQHAIVLLVQQIQCPRRELLRVLRGGDLECRTPGAPRAHTPVGPEQGRIAG